MSEWRGWATQRREGADGGEKERNESEMPFGWIRAVPLETVDDMTTMDKKRARAVKSSWNSSSQRQILVMVMNIEIWGRS